MILPGKDGSLRNNIVGTRSLKDQSASISGKSLQYDFAFQDVINTLDPITGTKKLLAACKGEFIGRKGPKSRSKIRHDHNHV